MGTVTHLCALVLAVTLAAVCLVSTTSAQCVAPFPIEQNLTIARWGDTGTDVQNCNQRYITTEWESAYLNVANPTRDGVIFPPTGWETLGFDDSAWELGVLPFGGDMQCSAELNQTVPDVGFINTFWPPNNAANDETITQSYLAVRLEFFISPTLYFQTDKFYLQFIVDNDLVEIWVNGVQQTLPGQSGREGCDGVSKLINGVLDSSSLQPEANVLALLAEDRGSQSYLNYELVVGVCGSAPVTNTTCTITTPPVRDCLVPCASNPDDFCEYVSGCTGEGLVMDPEGQCTCEIGQVQACPRVTAGMVPDDGVCYMKETQTELRLLSCENLEPNLCAP